MEEEKVKKIAEKGNIEPVLIIKVYLGSGNILEHKYSMGMDLKKERVRFKSILNDIIDGFKKGLLFLNHPMRLYRDSIEAIEIEYIGEDEMRDVLNQATRGMGFDTN